MLSPCPSGQRQFRSVTIRRCFSLTTDTASSGERCNAGAIRPITRSARGGTRCRSSPTRSDLSGNLARYWLCAACLVHQG